jgi:hypothetical protein
MRDMQTTLKVDLLALGATVLALVMTVAYVVVIRSESGELAIWFVTAMAIAIACGAYGCSPGLPQRRIALLVCGVILGALGLLAILTIGLPILVASVLAWIAFARARSAPSGSSGR